MRFACAGNEPIQPGDTLEIGSLEPDLSFQGRVAWVREGDPKHVGVEREEPVIFSLERRRYVRVNATDLTASLGLQHIKVLDVSLRGLRVETPERLNVGDVQLDLHLPGSPLSLSARVLESRGSMARLELTHLSPEAHEQLGVYLTNALVDPA